MLSKCFISILDVCYSDYLMEASYTTTVRNDNQVEIDILTFEYFYN